ncbi:DUF488 domain-containing protein [Pseudomonas putida]|nr:DUF488 domain-containing protein [Pseudomonas putida]
MNDMPDQVFTVGHSTRSIEAFVALMRSFGVQVVVDIRTVPRSRTNPQYNLDVLPGLLQQEGMDHRRIAALGGLRKKSKTVAPHTNGLWRNRSFHNYADHALGAEFAAGLDELIELSEARRCAIMCSEAVWWRCHRRIVADHLLVRGIEVMHIMDIGKATRAQLTPGAEVHGLKVEYPLP